MMCTWTHVYSAFINEHYGRILTRYVEVSVDMVRGLSSFYGHCKIEIVRIKVAALIAPLFES